MTAAVESEGPFTAADLPGSLDEAGRLVLVRRLVREGFLRVIAGEVVCRCLDLTKLSGSAPRTSTARLIEPTSQATASTSCSPLSDEQTSWPTCALPGTRAGHDAMKPALAVLVFGYWDNAGEPRAAQAARRPTPRTWPARRWRAPSRRPSTAARSASSAPGCTRSCRAGSPTTSRGAKAAPEDHRGSPPSIRATTRCAGKEPAVRVRGRGAVRVRVPRARVLHELPRATATGG